MGQVFIFAQTNFTGLREFSETSISNSSKIGICVPGMGYFDKKQYNSNE